VLRQPSAFTDDDLRELEHGIPRRDWAWVHEYLGDNWHPGEAFAVFAPAEGGKSHLIRYGLVPMWDYRVRSPMTGELDRHAVMWVRVKQRDDSTRGFGTKVDRYPVIERAKYKVRHPNSQAWEDDPEHYLIQLPAYRFDANAPQDRSASWHQARRICGEILDKAFREGNIVVVIDEIQAVSGKTPPGLDLAPSLENCLQRGRTQPITMITGSQQPAWNAPSVYDQAKFVALGRTLDEARFERIGQLGGDREAIEPVLPTLKGARHPDGPEFLIINRHTGDMMISVAPPEA
jgi:hypothetical protein